MSTTYEIVCRTCGESLWVGQGTSRPYLYGSQKHLDRLCQFLHRHRGKTHKLIYGDGDEVHKYIRMHTHKEVDAFIQEWWEREGKFNFERLAE